MSKNNRVKMAVVAPGSRAEMETLVGEITGLKLREIELKAEMDQRLAAVKAKYEEDLGGVTEEIAARLPRALAWAEAHPEAFGKAKSLAMLHGVIGWRLNTPSLKLLGGMTWKKALEVIKALRIGRLYIRVKEEVDKEAILANRNNLSESELRAMGMRIEHEEVFFVEPNVTASEKRETAAA